MSQNLPRILLTMGEASGIGPELLVKIAQQEFNAEIVVLADQDLLNRVADDLALPLQLLPIDWRKQPERHRKGYLRFENIQLPADVVAGQLQPENASAIIKMLSRAGELALANSVDAIVTAPVHKAVLNQVNPDFLGHTEFFAEQANVAQVVMMLANSQLRVALATTHIPLSQVSHAITQELIEQIVKIIHHSFVQFDLPQPKIAVCGLNPHAGENGLLGLEDREVIAPAITQLQHSGIAVEGPFPSDSLFTLNKREIYDVFLAMYHDQGLPVVKALGFGQCANITLGLPYIRTSVDHGTAMDIAAQRIASPSSLNYAIKYAIQLAKGKLPQ
jgi:4-hydroxythreonine-4-phosphate dehydrogenase